MPMGSFYADHFDTTPHADAINDMLGHDLAAWLHDDLQAIGYAVDPVIAEDYGYGFWLNSNGFPYWVVINQIEDETHNTNHKPRWLVHVVFDPGCLGWIPFRKRPDALLLVQINQDIHQILTSDDRLEDIEWWADDIYKGTPTATPP